MTADEGTLEVNLPEDEGTGSTDADNSGDDGDSSSADDEDTNNLPIANAGADQVVAVGALVSLSAAASTDLDNDPLSYRWSLISQPAESNTELDGDASMVVEFTADMAGTYLLSLVVADPYGSSEADTVTVTVSNQGVDITDATFTQRAGSCSSYVGSYYANVTDIQRALAFDGDIVITLNDELCAIQSNNIPNHDFNDATAAFATNVSAQQASYFVPANPVLAAASTELSLGTTNAVFLNGVALDLLAAACYDVGNEPLGREKIGCGEDQIDNPWRYDPMSPLNGFGTDQHNAHTQPDGTYHYHGNPMAMFDLDCEANGTASPVIGFAADGFPIFGPCFADPQSGIVSKAQSSYQLRNNGGHRQAVTGYSTPQAGTGDIASDNYDGQFRGDYEYIAGSGDLDECNGMTIDGQYGYYVTNSYPWVIGCFKGSPDTSFSKTGMALDNLLHLHE
ncbi:YHYH protein [Corallincola platygyrae]|uniref:YHYH protein n=1 Tax=Corallincola platygyrae TaxID=1193278 RepID=A0ABW4XLI7_9GAMM